MSGVSLRANECVTAVTVELRRVGITPNFARGGKHWQVQWQSRTGEPRMVTVPSTPSDFRSARNTRSDVRRILREDGMLGEENQRSGKKPNGFNDPEGQNRRYISSSTSSNGGLVLAAPRELSQLEKLEQRLVKLGQLQETINKGIDLQFGDIIPTLVELKKQFEDLVPPMLDLQSQLEGRIVRLERKSRQKTIVHHKAAPPRRKQKRQGKGKRKAA